MGSDRIPVSKWREWDTLAVAGRAFIARQGRDIPITCGDSGPGIGGKRKRKKVICLDTMEVFDSIGKAGIAAGAKTGAQIAKVCRGELNHYRGLRYAFYDDYIAGTMPGQRGKKRESCKKLWKENRGIKL